MSRNEGDQRGKPSPMMPYRDHRGESPLDRGGPIQKPHMMHGRDPRGDSPMSRDGGRPGQQQPPMSSAIRRGDSPMSRDERGPSMQPRGGSPSLINNDPKQPLKSCLKQRSQSPFGSGPGRPNELPFRDERFDRQVKLLLINFTSRWQLPKR